MYTMNTITSNATLRIGNARDYVTKHIQKVLAEAGIPETIAAKYSANYCHGGEWILDDDNGLANQDIHLMTNKDLIQIVKELENLD